MRINYFTDQNGALWAVINKSDGTYVHYYIGIKDRTARIRRFYAHIVKYHTHYTKG